MLAKSLFSKKQNRKVQRRSNRQRRIQLESLEDRKLMAADFGINVFPLPTLDAATPGPVASANANDSGWTAPTVRATGAAQIFIDGIDDPNLDDWVIVESVEGNHDVRVTVKKYDEFGNEGFDVYQFYIIPGDHGVESFVSINFDGNDGDDYFVNNTAIRSSARGHSGNDVLYGGSVGDWLFGGEGDDFLSGRHGDDLVKGFDGNDVIYGGNGGDDLFGGAGDDQIRGGRGDDNIYGGADNDRLFGQQGEDKIWASAKPSWVDYNLPGNDYVHGGSGNDRIYGGIGDDILHGSFGNDVILGREGDDKIYGYHGEDWLDGGAGWDQLFGGSGDDQLFGRTGRDYLYGGSDDDILDGGDDMERDHLYGQLGADTFVRHKHFWNDDPDAHSDVNGSEGDEVDNDWYGANYGNTIPRNQSPNRRW